MEIGTEQPAIIVEPLEDPFRTDPAPTETPAPVEVPDEPLVPA
jgi:hypothetical protein